MFLYTALIQNISALTSLLPLFFFILFFKRNNKKEIRVILFYCTYSSINDFILINIQYIQKYDSLGFFLLSLFTIVEYLCISALIYIQLNSNLFKKIILVVSPLFILFSLIQYFTATTYVMDSLTITVENIIIISYCLFFFFEQINKVEVTFIYSSYKFWLILSILLYSTGTFFLFMFSSSMSDTEWEKWSPINFVFNIVKNVLFCRLFSKMQMKQMNL